MCFRSPPSVVALKLETIVRPDEVPYACVKLGSDMSSLLYHSLARGDADPTAIREGLEAAKIGSYGLVAWEKGAFEAPPKSIYGKVPVLIVFMVWAGGEPCRDADG